MSAANKPSDFTGRQGGGHETDETATGGQENAIRASLRGLVRRTVIGWGVEKSCVTVRRSFAGKPDSLFALKAENSICCQQL